MVQIPSESRTALGPLLRIVGGTRSRTMSSKEIGTLHSRQNHLINFLADKKLGRNVALKGFTLNIRNIIMACYTANLAAGETLV